MTTVYDIPADLLIRRVAEEMKKRPEFTPPEWAEFAKTGVHKEQPPQDPDWWFVGPRPCSGGSTSTARLVSKE